MAPVYANRAAFEAYVPGWVTDDATTLDRMLELAERDVERLFPLRPILRTGTFAGHRFDTSRMLTFEATALRDAVCAQALFLIEADDGVRAGTAPTRVKGPDFEVEYASNANGGRVRYSGELEAELAPLERYRTRTARLRGR